MDSTSAGSPSFENQTGMRQVPNTVIEDTLEKLHELWTSMGLNEEEKQKRIAIFYEYVNNMMNGLYEEEKEQYKKLKKVIKDNKNEVEELCWELGLPFDEFSLPDQDLLPLQMKDYLSSQLNKLKKEKCSREEALGTLRETEKSLCLLLDMSPLQLSTTTGLPTKQDLLDLEARVRSMQVEKDHRWREYYSSKRELTTIMEETECLPDTTLGSNMLFDEDENVILSEQNIRELKDLVEKAYHKKCELEEKMKILKDRLQTLWDRLNIDEVERITFLADHSGCKMSVVTAFEREIVKCEELKRQNIGKYIDKMRNELTELWDKCYYSQEEREKFTYFYSDDCSETLLDLHDAEVQRLKEYYIENEKIFSLICKRNVLWENMVLFEKKCSNPNRFTNRGGQLLQEEKQRNRLMKDLPKLETEIFNLIIEQEERTGKRILVNGKDFEKVVEEERNQYVEDREKEKLERQRQKSNNTKPLTNCSNITPAKRLPNTPLRTPSKYRRLNSGMSSVKVPGGTSRATGLSLTPAPGSIKTPKNRSRMLRQSPRTVPRRKNSTNKQQLMKNEAAGLKNKSNDENLIESISTYSEFTESLKSQREGLMNSTETKIPAEIFDFNA